MRRLIRLERLERDAREQPHLVVRIVHPDGRTEGPDLPDVAGVRVIDLHVVNERRAS